MKCRHYGSPSFDPAKFNPPLGVYGLNKPLGGLWATPWEKRYTWAEYIRDEIPQWEHRLDSYFDFEIKGTVARIHEFSDMEKLKWGSHPTIPGVLCPDFAGLAKGGVDAIHLTEQGELATRFTFPHSLCGWDFECVLVLNASAVVPLERIPVS